MMINILIDVIIVALISCGAVIGLTKGFISSVARPVKWILSVIFAFSLCTGIADAFIFPLIEEPITNQISAYLIEKCSHVTAQNAMDELPTLLKMAAGISGIDISSLGADPTAEFIPQLVDKLAYTTIHLISVIISFFLIYFVSRLILKLLFALVDHMFDGGVFGVLNKTLGFVFTTLIAFFSVWILTSVFGYVISLPAFADTPWIVSFDGGIIYNFFKGLSPIDLLLSF